MAFRDFEKFCRLNGLGIFTINDLKVLFSNYSPEYVRIKIHRWKEQGYIDSLKNGLYCFPEANLDEFEVASRLISPSYISMETALSHYSIIPDVSGEVISVTTKNTRNFEINGVRYSYHHVKNSFFADYIHLDNSVFMATREKAILDFFYFRKPDENNQFFERLNQEVVKAIDIKILKKIGKAYPLFVRNLINFFTNAVTK